MSSKNREDLLSKSSLRPTTTNASHGNGLLRNRSKRVGVAIETPRVEHRAMDLQYYQRRHNNITTYKPTNMPGIKRKQYTSSSLLQPRRTGVVAHSDPLLNDDDDDIITIDDKPKRKLIESMRLKDSTRPNAEQRRQIQREQQHIGYGSGPAKQNTKHPYTTTTRTTETKRKQSRTIQDDSDEGIDPTPAKKKTSQSISRRNNNTNITSNDNHIVTTIEDDDDDDILPASKSDVFDDFSVFKSPTPIRHKKRRHVDEGIDDPDSFYEGEVTAPSSTSASSWGGLTGESSTSSCHHRTNKPKKHVIVNDTENDDDLYDEWIAQVGKDEKGKGRELDNNKNNVHNDNKYGNDEDEPASNLSSNLIVPKRRKPIVFYEDADDIPVKQTKNTDSTIPTTYDNSGKKTKVKTTNLHSKELLHSLSKPRPLTRSSAKSLNIQKSIKDGFSCGVNTVRGLFGQPQHITIDDDDDDDSIDVQDNSLFTSSSANGQELLFHYPSSAPGGVAVVREDANRLMDGQMLNDSIIDFYVKWLLINTSNTKPSSLSLSSSSSFDDNAGRSITERVHIFNTFFFARLKQPTKGDPYENVKKWASKINLFEKDIVFVPIHEASHWYLLVVCNLKKCIPKEGECIDLSNDNNSDDKAVIYSLDSMGLKRTRSANRVIKYLHSAAQDRLGIDANQFIKPVYVQANVPLQPNAYDCGIYVLHFIETFLQQPEKLTSVLTAKQLDDTVWQSAKIAEKRELISDLITGLCQTHQQQEQDTTSPMNVDNKKGKREDEADNKMAGTTSNGFVITSSADDPPSDDIGEDDDNNEN